MLKVTPVVATSLVPLTDASIG